jgi:hypothetical protein
VRVTAITGDTLLKLVGGQVPHELSEYSLADIHPSLSTIATPVPAPAVLAAFGPENFSNRKIANSPYLADSGLVIGEAKYLAGQ